MWACIVAMALVLSQENIPRLQAILEAGYSLPYLYVTVSAKTRHVRTIKKLFFIHSALLAVSKEWITKVSAFCGK